MHIWHTVNTGGAMLYNGKTESRVLDPLDIPLDVWEITRRRGSAGRSAMPKVEEGPER